MLRNYLSVVRTVKPFQNHGTIQRRWIYGDVKKSQVVNPAAEGFVNHDDSSLLPFQQIPGPSALPILGTLHHFLPAGKYRNVPLHELIDKLNKEYGHIVKLAGLPGKRDMVFVYNPDDIRLVYRTEGVWPYRPGIETVVYYRKKLRPDIFEETVGLAPAQGEEWGKFRSQINQTMMQPKTIKQYIQPIDNISMEFVERIKEIVDRNGVTPDNFNIELNKWSMESIARVALDTKLGIIQGNLSDDSPPMQLIKSFKVFVDLLYDFEIEPSLWKYIPSAKFNKYMKHMDIMTNVVVKYIDEAIQKVQNNSPKKADGELSVLEKLYSIDKKMAYIMAIDIMTAAVDTTAGAASIALYYLAKNPQKQDILRDHIQKIIPNKKTPLTQEHMHEMSYLRATIKEAARLTPIAIGNFRRTTQNISLSGYKIPEGTDVLLAHGFQSNLEENFPKAKRFIPERWLRNTSDTEGEAPKCPVDHSALEPIRSAREAHPFAFMPFGFGARMCAGKRFADLELETLICNIVRNYKIDWAREDLKFVTKTITAPVGALKYKFTEI